MTTSTTSRSGGGGGGGGFGAGQPASTARNSGTRMPASYGNLAGMALPDRIEPLCDLLLGAAHADADFKDRERDEVRGLLEDLAGKLTPELEARIDKFDPKSFDM